MVPVTAAGRHPRQARPITPLIGRKLDYVQLGHAVVLGFTGGFRVLIEAVAHLDGPDGRVDVEPGDNPSDALATLLGDVVRTAEVCETAELRIGFGSGAELLVDADADVESWAVAGPGDFLIVCVDRGELAVWKDAGQPPA